MEGHAEQIVRIIAALSHRTTLEEVAETLLDELRRLLDASAVSIGIFDEARMRTHFVRSLGYPAEVLARWSELPIDNNLFSTIRHGEPLFVTSRTDDTRFDQKLRNEFGDGAAFLVPLAANGRVLGCLGASFTQRRDFDGATRELVMTLARQCALSIERAQLYEAERTARAAADAARRELEAVLRQLPVAVGIMRSGDHALFNAQMETIFGRPLGPSDRAFAAAHLENLDGTPLDQDALPMLRALTGQATAQREIYVRRSDGTRRRVRAGASPIYDDAGAICAAVGVLQDITDEHRAAEELRASHRRYAAVLRATNDVIWDIDMSTHILEWNGALERVFGWRPEDTRAHPQGGYAWWIEQIHPDERQRIEADYQRAAASGADTWCSEYRFRRADGSYVPTLDRCVFERDERGRLIRVVGAISDVSEQHRLLRELRDAVAVRDDFLSIAGHELLTPLAALSAQLLGLRRLPLDEPGRADKLAAAERQVRRLGLLVDELLDVSRIVHGRLQLEREPIDLAALAREVAARLGEEFQRGSTPLAVEAPAPALGRWDRLRIDLVLTNLLTNALRYGRKQPVRLSVDEAGERVRLTVEDQGIGIGPEDRERIFERFARAVPARQFGGLGVGLWLARQIVDAHGGTLTVESTLGVGSRFTVDLPRVA